MGRAGRSWGTFALAITLEGRLLLAILDGVRGEN